MANQDSGFGFRPSRMLGSGYNSTGQTQYVIANNEASAIFQGDPVRLVAERFY